MRRLRLILVSVAFVVGAILCLPLVLVVPDLGIYIALRSQELVREIEAMRDGE